jgi:hypothetical protein
VRNEVKYQLLKPQTIVLNYTNNSVTWNRYLNLGLDVPIKSVKSSELETTFNWERGYVGVGYTPEIPSFSVKFGATIIKFKKKK